MATNVSVVRIVHDAEYDDDLLRNMNAAFGSRDMHAVQVVKQNQSGLSITSDEWGLLQVVMRSLTWGKLDASKAWYELVESVDARIKDSKVDTSELNEGK